MIVRLPREARSSVHRLAAIPLAAGGIDPATGAPRIVRLGHFAAIAPSASPQTIELRDMKRVVSVAANSDGRTLTDVSNETEQAVARLSIPAGYSVTLGGEQGLPETVGYMVESLALAVVFLYLILASQFGSFLKPLAIMLSLPLSLIGALLALALTRGTLNIMSMIGIIMLMGLVTKNAILLVDFANQARARGQDRESALVDAGELRLRPIVMTTLAMIFGMLPTALALGAGAEFRAPMAHAVIGGLITSTLLTLVVVPVVYTFLDDLGAGAIRERVTRASARLGRASQRRKVAIEWGQLLGVGSTAASIRQKDARRSSAPLVVASIKAPRASLAAAGAEGVRDRPATSYTSTDTAPASRSGRMTVASRNGLGIAGGRARPARPRSPSRRRPRPYSGTRRSGRSIPIGHDQVSRRE